MLVDVTIVRIVLVPATMRLLGDWNWWLPRWLDRWLPSIDVEGGTGLPEPEYRPGYGPTTPARERDIRAGQRSDIRFTPADDPEDSPSTPR